MSVIYKLYAMSVNNEAVAIANKSEFSRITTDYVLVYTDSGEAPKNAVEITEAETPRLAMQDAVWLIECNATIIMRETEKSKAEVIASISDKITALEKALEQEEKDLENGKGVASVES